MAPKTNYVKSAKMYALYSTGLSLERVGQAFGCTRQSVYELLIRHGYTLRGKPCPLPFIMFNGYKYTLRNTGYYGRTNGHRTLLHRDAWEFHRGPIPNSRDVHHIDGNRENNAISNLELMAKSEHTRRYCSGHNQHTPTHLLKSRRILKRD